MDAPRARPARRTLRRLLLTAGLAVATTFGAVALLSRDGPLAAGATSTIESPENVRAAIAALDTLIMQGTTVRWPVAPSADIAPPTLLFDKWTRDLNDAARSRFAQTVSFAEERARARLGLRLLIPESDLAGGADWQRLSPGAATPDRVVLLVHGLDEPGEIWDDLAPLLRSKGYSVARLDYPNDQAIGRSADILAASLRALRAAGTTRVDLVCHSMGGLVARDVLTRADDYAGDAKGHDDLPDVDRAILVGTPNRGAPLARLRLALEFREQAIRLFDDGALCDALTGFFCDGAGDAGRDLLPGSDFLATLNARPLPLNIALTLVVGNASPLGETDVLSMLDTTLARLLLADEDAAAVASQARDLFNTVGDGVVPRSSALLDGVEDVVEISANHRSLLRSTALGDAAKRATGDIPGAPGAVEVILDRLERSTNQPAQGI